MGPCALAEQPLWRSALVVDQFELASPGSAALLASFRSTLKDSSAPPVSVYIENLDLGRFGGSRFEVAVQAYFREKYQDKPIGILVPVGSAALELVLSLRPQLWPEAPVIFAAVDEGLLAQLTLPPEVTGTTIRALLNDSASVARALVPGLRRLAIIGDPPERQFIRSQVQEQLKSLANEFELIDLTRSTMSGLKQRVASLPADSAIVYIGLTVDAENVAYTSHQALAALAEVANRPIVVQAETQLGTGAAGGVVVSPGAIGHEAAQLALRVLAGENPANIPVTTGKFMKPVFDWRQLQRWNVREDRLPPGSEIRFREPGMWEQYRTQILAAFAILLFQSAIIFGLLFERRRRLAAEKVSRNRLLENIRLNRVVTAEAISASLSHELKQPLAAIMSNAEAAQLLLEANPLNVGPLKEILADILAAERRADHIIAHLRQLLKRRPEIEYQEFDLNESVQGALRILATAAASKGVKVDTDLAQGAPPVRADPVHAQQVILNLAVNAIEAMASCAPDRRRLTFQTAVVGESEAMMVAVSDNGPGIPEDRLESIFEPFVTTKDVGTGLGLSIARTIIETYGGRIWAENRPSGGAVFRFTLPTAKARSA
jgi:signal transduction histidine kinase